MVYLINLVTQFKRQLPLYFYLSIIIVILCFCLLLILNYKYKNNNYKIYNFKLNAIIIYFYLSLFFCSFFWIRYNHWGFFLDLMFIYQNFFVILQKIPPLYFLILVLCLINAFLLLRLAKQLLLRELFKRHFYLYFKLFYEDLNADIIKYHPYVNFIQKISQNYSYTNIIDDYVWYSFIFPYYTVYKEAKQFPAWVEKLLMFFFSNNYQLLLIFVIIYDCVCNNWVLHWIFYYLPFYFIIHLFKKTTNFLANNNQGLDSIIYERYYEEENVIYVNTTDEEDTFIIRYIENNFQCLSHEVKTWEEKELLLNFPSIFKYNRRFVKVIDRPFIFRNEHTSQELDRRESIIISEDISNKPLNAVEKKR